MCIENHHFQCRTVYYIGFFSIQFSVLSRILFLWDCKIGQLELAAEWDLAPLTMAGLLDLMQLTQHSFFLSSHSFDRWSPEQYKQDDDTPLYQAYKPKMAIFGE